MTVHSPRTKREDSSEYRNIAIPKALQKRVAHIAIDLEMPISEIASVLLAGFCTRFEAGKFDSAEWEKLRKQL